MELNNLRPSLLWQHFLKLCEIPRPSGHEAEAVQYIRDTADHLGLQSMRDSAGNILVKKPASPGFEHTPTITLQSHLDMVPQKNSDVLHNFFTDSIKPFVDGEWVRARGTTLGADNGIGAAAALAIMEEHTLVHGPLEALFTIDEETGMTGAANLDRGFLCGTILINLDSEREGELCTGCAGGINASVKMYAETVAAAQNSVPFSVSVGRLRGGHSGIDINLGRGNALLILARLIYRAVSRFDLRISDFHGGTVRNAIPREAFALLTLNKPQQGQFLKFCEEFQQTIGSELRGADPGFSLSVRNCKQKIERVLRKDFQDRFIRALVGCPNGVFRMNCEIDGVVESSGNVATVKTKNNTVTIESLLRSSGKNGLQSVCESFEAVFRLAGADVVFGGEYPGWQPDPDSFIVRTMAEVYRTLYGKDPDVTVVHAGLECGLIGAAYPSMQLVSCGPEIHFPHSPDEKVNIKSVEKFWDFLCATLTALCKK